MARENGRGYYKGTADAVYQNLQYIREQATELVLILSGDHIYKMGYSWMLKFHEEKQADATFMKSRAVRQFSQSTEISYERLDSQKGMSEIR